MELLTLRGHSGSVTDAVFSADGRHLATAGGHSLTGGEVRLWDATTPSVAERLQCIAKLRTAALFGQGLLRDEVVQALRDDDALGDDMRSRALAAAEDGLEDADAVNLAAWAVVKVPSRDAAAYRAALRRIQTACDRDPADADALNTLGAAHYRLRQYPEAVMALKRAQKMHAAVRPSMATGDLVLLAMALYQLDDKPAAEQTLKELRAVLNEHLNVADDDWKPLLAEAEALLKCAPLLPRK